MCCAWCWLSSISSASAKCPSPLTPAMQSLNLSTDGLFLRFSYVMLNHPNAHAYSCWDARLQVSCCLQAPVDIFGGCPITEMVIVCSEPHVEVICIFVWVVMVYRRACQRHYSLPLYRCCRDFFFVWILLSTYFVWPTSVRCRYFCLSPLAAVCVLWRKTSKWSCVRRKDWRRGIYVAHSGCLAMSSFCMSGAFWKSGDVVILDGRWCRHSGCPVMCDSCL